MNTETPRSDETLLVAWYQFVATQPDSVDALLGILRERSGKTLVEQQQEFGATDVQFMRLRGMLAPRPDRFTLDAHAMAIACELESPFVFVNALLLARNLTQSATREASGYYRAAFDAINGMEEAPPEE